MLLTNPLVAAQNFEVRALFLATRERDLIMVRQYKTSNILDKPLEVRIS